jgi:nucleoside-triphosphatase THEP1
VRVLIEGRPGSGKTTAAARLAQLLAERNIEVRGFVTDEVRESDNRVGFTVRSFRGESATLAHVALPAFVQLPGAYCTREASPASRQDGVKVVGVRHVG